MIGPNFIDDIDCDTFFDNIDDLLDFPDDDLQPNSLSLSNSSFPPISPTHSLPASVFSNNTSTDISLPYEDIVQLEWLSNFVEDSFSGGSLAVMNNNKQDSSSNIKEDSSHNQFQSSSPVSVLESSSSNSNSSCLLGGPESSFRRGRARSKRPRPATFNPRSPVQLTETHQRLTAPKESENFAESRLVIKIPKQFNSEYKKKTKIKLSVWDDHESRHNEEESGGIRKCMHCEITKTPQWRAGPMGPKTLCNACGVRYKSGRLFPEYRPAASPTFLPSLHSNSHKKVLEMRNNISNSIIKQ